MCLFIRRNNSEAIVERGKVHEQLMTNYNVYQLTPWAKLTFSRVKLTAYRAQLVGSPADCSMFWKHKHGEDQRSAVVHFILLNGRFPPSTLLLWGDLSKWKHSNWWIRVRVCSHMPSCSSSITLYPLPASFCSLKLSPSPSGNRLLWNPFHINYFRFPHMPCNQSGWRTMNNLAFQICFLKQNSEILFVPLLVNVCPPTCSLSILYSWIKNISHTHTPNNTIEHNTHTNLI